MLKYTELEKQSFLAVKAQLAPRGVWIHARAMLDIAERLADENYRLEKELAAERKK